MSSRLVLVCSCTVWESHISWLRRQQLRCVHVLHCVVVPGGLVGPVKALALAMPHESSTMRNMYLGAHSSSATPELCICNGKDEVTEIFGVKDCFDVQDIPADTQFNVEPSLARRSHRMHCSAIARTTHPMRQRVKFCKSTASLGTTSPKSFSDSR